MQFKHGIEPFKHDFRQRQNFVGENVRIPLDLC